MEERTDQRFANFMALFANAHAAKGRSFKASDFMPVKPKQNEGLDEKELFAKFDAIFANMKTVTEKR